MWLPDSHSTHLKAPVPMTLVVASGPSMFSLLRMRRYCRKSKAPGRGLSDLRMIVYLSGFSMVVHQALPTATVDANGFLGSRARSTVYSTSSLLNSRPLC